MTTNDVEALDPALLRPGRIDYKLCMGKAVTAQKMELYRRFFPAAPVVEAERAVGMWDRPVPSPFPKGRWKD